MVLEIEAEPLVWVVPELLDEQAHRKDQRACEARICTRDALRSRIQPFTGTQADIDTRHAINSARSRCERLIDAYADAFKAALGAIPQGKPIAVVKPESIGRNYTHTGIICHAPGTTRPPLPTTYKARRGAPLWATMADQVGKAD